MLLHDLPGAGQADSVAECSPERVGAAREHVEHPRQVLGRDPDAVVAHAQDGPDPGMVLLPSDLDPDNSTARAVLHGVTEQVVEHPDEPVAVPVALDRTTV